MKLYRYMSFAEMQKLTSGMELIYNRSTCKKSKTTSKGFCFLGEKTEIPEGRNFYNEPLPGYVFDPVVCYNFLSGIVTNDILVEFEIQDLTKVKMAKASYARPFSDKWDEYIDIIEYYAESYNRDIFIPLRYAMVKDEYHAEWYNFN